ncbi:hypothetical protein X976_5420 [Burkholderia pseudomallei MSHR7500]|nr:hypothetical protein DO62_1245 [Burkholderia pseudomallei]KGS86195.1 hypothetical protein X976_5420 [Burkholderia pseudomallei MSHR7500]
MGNRLTHGRRLQTSPPNRALREWAAATARTEPITHDRRPRAGLLSCSASASPSQRPARRDSHAYIHPAEARPSRHRRCLRTVPAITRKKANNMSSQPPSELTRPHLFTLPPASPPSLPRWTTRADCPASLPLPAARRRPSSVSAGSCPAAPPSQPQRASSPTVAAPEPALLILRRIDFEARHGRRRPAPEKSHRSDPINQGSAPCAGPAYGRSPAIYSCKTSPQADFSVVRQRAGSPRKSSPLLFEYKNNIYISDLQNTPDTMVEIFYSRTFSPFASGSTLIVSTSPPENSHLYQKASAPTVLVPQYPRGFAAR